MLAPVEQGIVTFLGATTENPSFEVISALLSRCQVYVLKPLLLEDLKALVDRAMREDEILRKKELEIQEYDALVQYSGGDARRLLNALEIIAQAVDDGALITNDLVREVIQQNMVRYDKGGEQHYDMASAFSKSSRGSDPNAAVYWRARMIAGDETPG